MPIAGLKKGDQVTSFDGCLAVAHQGQFFREHLPCIRQTFERLLSFTEIRFFDKGGLLLFRKQITAAAGDHMKYSKQPTRAAP